MGSMASGLGLAKLDAQKISELIIKNFFITPPKKIDPYGQIQF